MLFKGVRILKALECLWKEKEHRAYHTQISFIHDGLREGKPMYSSMNVNRKLFHPFLITMVCAGEEHRLLGAALCNASKTLGTELSVRTEKPKYGEKIVFYSQLASMLAYKASWLEILTAVKDSDYSRGELKEMAREAWKAVSDTKEDSEATKKAFESMFQYENLFNGLDKAVIQPKWPRDVIISQLNMLAGLYETISRYKYGNGGDKIIFYEELGTLLARGLNETAALDVVLKCGHLSSRWMQIVLRLADQGDPLSVAMSKQKVFGESEVEVVRAKESSDWLWESVQSLAEHYKLRADYKK